MPDPERSKASTPHTSGVRARSCGTREVHRNEAPHLHTMFAPGIVTSGSPAQSTSSPDTCVFFSL
jgi:hypothetical protein